MGFILSFIILFIAIAAVVDAVNSPLPTGKKILWMLLILMLPVLGIILYFLLGKPSKA